MIPAVLRGYILGSSPPLLHLVSALCSLNCQGCPAHALSGKRTQTLMTMSHADMCPKAADACCPGILVLEMTMTRPRTKGTIPTEPGTTSRWPLVTVSCCHTRPMVWHGSQRAYFWLLLSSHLPKDINTSQRTLEMTVTCLRDYLKEGCPTTFWIMVSFSLWHTSTFFEPSLCSSDLHSLLYFQSYYWKIHFWKFLFLHRLKITHNTIPDAMLFKNSIIE